MKDVRTFIVSNLHRGNEVNSGNNTANNNDVTVTLPDSIFSGRVEAINLKHLSIDYSLETVGDSNFEFSITYPETSTPTVVTLDLAGMSATFVRTDQDLASLVASSINTAIGSTAFQVYYDPITLTTSDMHHDSCDMLCTYTIFNNDGAPFVLDFSSKRSLGPLVGFGNGIYEGEYSYSGGNVPPVGNYESVRVSNKAYDPNFNEFDFTTDSACKMDLYDSAGIRISNYRDPRDATISIPIFDGYIYSPRELADLIETEMNRYSSSHFTDSPVFAVDFDLASYSFTFRNDKGVRFGIGFRFNRATGGNNYGSLHRHLGFNKQNYVGYTRITSVRYARIFDRAYVGEYLFVCSDLIRHNYDSALIVAESGENASQYESIFTIPVSQIDADGSYRPSFEDEHRVRIHASMLAKQYNESLTSAKSINFYLKASSGRHIKLDTQWAIKFEIEYVN